MKYSIIASIVLCITILISIVFAFPVKNLQARRDAQFREAVEHDDILTAQKLINHVDINKRDQ